MLTLQLPQNELYLFLHFFKYLSVKNTHITKMRFIIQNIMCTMLIAFPRQFS